MRLTIAALFEIVGLGLLAASAFVLHPAVGMAVTGAAFAWFGVELARGASR